MGIKRKPKMGIWQAQVKIPNLSSCAKYRKEASGHFESSLTCRPCQMWLFQMSTGGQLRCGTVMLKIKKSL